MPRLAPRRRFLRYGLAGIAAVAVVGVTGFEFVDHGVLPGKSELDQLDGACDVPAPDFAPYATPGPQYSGTFYSADFVQDDAVTHAAALEGIPVRVASGFDDPLYPGVQARARALPRNPGGTPAELAFGNGCHTAPFFSAQEPPSLEFLARHI